MSAVLWGIGDEITGSPPSAETTAIYQRAPASFGLLSAWYNGPSDLGFFTAVSRSSIDAIYAAGKSIEVIIWLANVTAYAIGSTFLDTDLPAIVNAYKGAGTTYFCLFTELETYYDKTTLAGRQYRDSLKTQYIKAYQAIHALAPRAKVGLGFTGQFWSGSVGTTRNLKYYQDGQGSTVSGNTQDNAVTLDSYTSADALGTYSDILWTQQMQGAVTYETGTTQSLLENQVRNAVAQFNTAYPGKANGISHFKVWDDPKSGGVPVAGADVNAQNTWDSIATHILYNSTIFDGLVGSGLSVWNLMTDHYVNLSGVIQDRFVSWLGTHYRLEGDTVTTLRQDVNFPGTDGDPWPTPFSAVQMSTGGNPRIVANGLGATTSGVGAFSDFVATLLNDTNVNGQVDIGCVVHWDWSATTPLQGQGFGIFLRAANDWANGNNPSQWVGAFIDTAGGPDIEYRNTGGSRVVVVGAASGTVPFTSGISNYCRFEVQGAAVRSSYWTSTTNEPTTPTLSGTMSSGPLTGGRFGFRIIGGNAAVTTYARVRDDLIYDFGTVVVPGDPAAGARSGARPRYRMRRRL